MHTFEPATKQKYLSGCARSDAPVFVCQVLGHHCLDAPYRFSRKSKSNMDAKLLHLLHSTKDGMILLKLLMRRRRAARGRTTAAAAEWCAARHVAFAQVYSLSARRQLVGRRHS